MKRKSAILVSLLCFLSATASANVHVVDGPAFGGEAQVLQVLDNEGQPAPGTEVHGVYYPASEIEEKVKVCVTDADGRCSWTPKCSGLVRLKALGNTDVVAVRYTKIPMSALLTFLVAASALFGGLGVSMYYLLIAKPASETDAPA